MLIEVDSKTYSAYFPKNPHQFISEPFIELNKHKAEKVIRLISDGDNVSIGLIAGIKDGILRSPFSAPFGGFHFRYEAIYITEIDDFIESLKSYVISQGLKGIEIILPPDLYHLTFNTKTINSFIRSGYQSKLPDITCWLDLRLFEGSFSHKNSREYYRQAIRNSLSFDIVTDEGEKLEVYNLVKENRASKGRPIFMTFQDIMETSKLWPTDFFKVINPDKTMVASAIFYQCHPEIPYAVFWGDSEIGRPLRAMDFLAFSLWTYYKNLGFKYLDMGTSTESGTPNIGLLRFKETHNCVSSLRYKFVWKPDMNQKEITDPLNPKFQNE